MKNKISKSSYKKGINCQKALWLSKNRPELIIAQDKPIFSQGNVVGELARDLFTGGKLVPFSNFNEMINLTKKLLNTTNIIYEASFSTDSTFVIADILIRNGKVWDIYEVKSSTTIKDTHIIDICYQYHSIKQHISVGKCYIVYINNSYIRDGSLDISQLFNIENITDKVLKIMPDIEPNLNKLLETLNNKEPSIDIGTYCNHPYECEFKDYCWRNIPKKSVFNLYRLNTNKKFDYYYQGKISYSDFKNEELSKIQSLQISCKELVNKEIIKNFVDKVKYPINFFDFETFIDAVPKFDKQKPYMQIPFQYSLHILDEYGNLTHKEFLAECGIDPREILVKAMLKDINKNGTIVAFNQSFEIARIKELAKFLPQYKNELLQLITRFVDLIEPFRNLGYYHPDFNGSFSIKSIIPAMFKNNDELNYKNLGCVQNGGDAMNVFVNLHLEKDEIKIKETRNDLLRYCHLDTLAMVKIWQKLLLLIRKNKGI